MFRSKAIISVLVCALVLCANASGYSGGTGEPNNPYQIASKADLLQLAGTTGDYGKSFVLTADISLAGETFTTAVIAPDTDTPTPDFQGTMFSGVFDGNGHTISNLTISAGATGNDCLGLFGCISETAVIKNLAVTNASISGTGADYCSAIVSWNRGLVQDSGSSGSISGQSAVGGVVGRNYPGNITRCYSTANVTGTAGNIGGLSGANSSVSSITDSYASGAVSGAGANVGGLVGTSSGSIARCYATGNASGCYVGGLAGASGGSITDCYARGNVTLTTADCVGGLVGYQGAGTINRCYSSGYVSGSHNAGGMLGYRASGTTTNSFWDITTSGKSGSAGGTGKTTALMKTQSTFTGAGWDFVGETANGTNDWWYMPANSYPMLYFQYVDPGIVATPVFLPDGGTYSSEPNVVVTCATAGATIHYTTSGIDPTESDPVITSGASVFVDHSLILKAKAWKNTMTPSAVKSGTYTLIVAAPSFAPDAGVYYSELNVIIACATPGATIHCTTNGIDPTESDPVIASGGSVVVDHSLTLKAKAWKGVMPPSEVKSGTYTLAVTTPSFNPAGGTYDSGQEVVITCVMAGATIHYTTNGLDPNESDPIIASGGSILVDHDLTLKAKAWKTGCTASSVMAAAYTFAPRYPYSGGNGVPENPYQIATKEDLLVLGSRAQDYKYSFVLTADIDLVGEAFTTAVIAPDTDTPTPDFQGTMFSGVFDGDDHAISNLTINAGATGNDCLSLFGCISETAVVKRLAVERVAITATGESDNCGVVVGWNRGNVQFCHSSGSISGQSGVGGVVGRNNPGNITSCYSTVDVTGSGSGVGGLAGGSTGGAVTESYATGEAIGVINVGGLIGWCGGGTISRCYATGNASGCYVGGLIGGCGGNITDSYARGNVTLTAVDCVGGLVGWQCGGSVVRCYSTGYVNGLHNAGGFIGYCAAGTTTASFWDTQTSGMNKSAGGTGKTTAQMKTQGTFTGAGWDFVGETANGTNDYWYIQGDSYPQLSFVVAMPVFSPDGGLFDSEPNVVVICTTAGATIHYTIGPDPNRTPDPTESDPVIASGASVHVDHNLTLKAKAWKSGMVPGAVQSATYTMQVLWAAPDSVSITIPVGRTWTQPLAVGNKGDADVTFTAKASLSRRTGGASPHGSMNGETEKVDDSGALPAIMYDAAATSAPGEILVRFRPVGKARERIDNLAACEKLRTHLGEITVKKDLGLVPGLKSIRLPKGMTVEEALAKLKDNKDILYAQPNYELKALVIPDDPKFTNLWGMNNTGQTGGVPDADIDAPEAWDIATGSMNEVVVAVIDTGVDYTHPDLAGNMWVNKGEIPGNGIDDDHNSYIDDVYGINTITGSGNPMDDHYHGTHCAGTIGGIGNNAVGVAGVCWNVKIMALKFLNSSGGGYTADAVEAVNYSVRMGARLSSNSWGGGGYNQALKDAIDAAGAADMLFVAAAGNDGSDTDVYLHYPSCYDSPSLISVMATDSTDARSYFSNYGLTTVDLGAPGSQIYSCQPGGTYQYLSGTSMATPHVAGACALLWSINPALANSEVKNILLASVDATLPGKCVSGGRLNLFSAVTMVPGGGRMPKLSVVSDEGTIAGKSAQDVVLMIEAGSLVGTYDGHVTFTVEDPYHPLELVVPVTVVVEPNDYVTEFFDASPVDMAHRTFTIRPTDAKHYRVCSSPAAVFPLEPNEANIISLGNDSFYAASLGSPPVNFFGQSYDTIYVGSNGYITFGSGDSAHDVSLAKHFSLPRISALFDDLDPSASGSVYLQRLGDKVVVTYRDVPESGQSNKNSFQVEIWHNGVIRLTYLDVSSTNTIVGISDGSGLPGDFIESDFTGYGTCDLTGDINGDTQINLVDYAAWADCMGQNTATCMAADLDGDLDVDFVDMAILVEHWLN